MADKIKVEYGFELLQKTVDNDIRKKEDAIILLVHWYLIKCGFKCLGYGISKTFEPSEKGTELLPEEWNKGSNYKLRYLKDGKLFLFYGVQSDEDMVMNLLRIEDEKITNVNFPLAQTVSELHGPLEVMIPSYSTVLYKLNKELIEPINPSNCKEQSTQTLTPNVERESRDIHIDPPPRNPSRHWIPEEDPRRVGGADLNPFGGGRGGGGGGMLFEPFRWGTDPRGIGGLGVPGRLPQGAVPPGARFDPFGPPDVNLTPRRSQNPDNDEFSPPGYNDMFM
ncbi:PREDICTED: proteasome inhibitor PI31 subunit [Polistes dominula]|uniref:Proteasome inhibitor PI31 subunit n=1 Tax=Polistes dominula TaxID=743375 RepID=A0ABM1IT85_POLDO|nr:PREDICTED: proteasome inhibitor PI31 subunit [Polistes dominula]